VRQKFEEYSSKTEKYYINELKISLLLIMFVIFKIPNYEKISISGNVGIPFIEKINYDY